MPKLKLTLGQQTTFSGIQTNGPKGLDQLHEFMTLLQFHMENEALTTVSILPGLLLPYKPLKLRCNNGNHLSDRRNETTAQLCWEIPVPDHVLTNYSRLILAVVPILDGHDSGNTQFVTSNNGRRIVHRGVIRTKDGQRSAIIKSMKQNPGLWWWSYLAVELNLIKISLERCMRCWSMGIQMQPTDFRQWSRSTMLMNVPIQLISHLGSHSASISTTLRTQAAQGIQTEDIDDIIEGSVGNIPDTTDASIFDMQNVI